MTLWPETKENLYYLISLNDFFESIKKVEGWRGQDGAAGEKGPYQIKEIYWIDSNMPLDYHLVINEHYSKLTMINYWKRYCPEDLKSFNLEVLSRIHNGGPTGHKKKATLRYWEKVKTHLDNNNLLER